MDNKDKPWDTEPTAPEGSTQSKMNNSQENTYWETQEVLQTPNTEVIHKAPSTDGMQEASVPKQETPIMQTPDQFYAYYQQQMKDGQQPNGQQTYGQQTNVQQTNDQQTSGNLQSYAGQPNGNQQPYTSQPPYNPQYYNNTGYQDALSKQKKKSRGKGIVALLIFLIIIGIGTATAYAYRANLSNALARLTKSPAEYYRYVEKKAFINLVKDTYSADLASENKTSYKITSDVSFDHETLDSLMSTTFDFTLTDLESMLGITFNSIGLDMLVASEDSLINQSMGLRLNQVNLITAQIFMDIANQNMYFRLPDLSDAYLYQSLNDQSTDDVLPDTSLLKETLTSANIRDFLNRYSDILFESLDQVEIKDNVKLTLDKLSTDATCFKVTLTEKDFYEITQAMIEEAKNDQFIKDLLTCYNISLIEYQEALAQAELELNSEQEYASDEPVYMEIYIDNIGNIIGRKLLPQNEEGMAGYTVLSGKNYQEYEVYLEGEGIRIFNVIGNQTKKDDTYSGDLTLEINNTYYDDTFSNLSFDLTYENVRKENKNKHEYLYGTFTLSSLDLMGMQVILDFDVKDAVQYNKLSFQLGASELVTVDTKIEFLDNYKVTMPLETAEIYDISQAETYLASVNIDAYIDRLSNLLGVDLESLLSLFLPEDIY